MSAPANAQSGPGWRFQISPYVWGPSLDGHVQPDPRLPRLEFDRSLDDIFEDLNGALFLNATARRGRFVAFADLTYADLSEGHEWTVRPTLVTPEIDISVDVDVQVSASTLAVGYSVVDEPQFVLDLMVGARIWSVDAELDVPNRIPRLPNSFSGSGSWGDPIIALRGRYQFAPDWSVIGYADYGGGVDSDTTWQAVGTVNYGFNERWFVSAGYRWLAFDFDDGDFEFDFQLGGPLVGVTYRF